MEALADPLNDRQVKTVKPPPHRPLNTNLMYPDPCNSLPSNLHSNS
jgi:serine/threonine-protein phosphatase 2B catalytic subunit